MKDGGIEQQKFLEIEKKTIEKQVRHSGKIEAYVFKQSYLEYSLPISTLGPSGQKVALSFIKKYYHSVCVIYASVWNRSDNKTDSCVVYNLRIWN